MSSDHAAALDAAGPKVLEMVASVPADLSAVKWFAAFAEQSAPGDAASFMARLYVAADNYCAEMDAQVKAGMGAARDFHAIILKHAITLSALAYGQGADPAQRAAATELLNGAGLSRYHVQADQAVQPEYQS